MYTYQTGTTAERNPYAIEYSSVKPMYLHLAHIFTANGMKNGSKPD